MSQHAQSLYGAVKYLVLNYTPGPVLRFLKKVHYARKLRTYPLEREPETRLLPHLVRPGDHAVDIGANVGLYTKVLSGLVGERGRVYSIEPVPETFEILCSNIRKLSLGNVVAINRAVSHACGTVAMAIPRHLDHAENFYRAHIVAEAPGNVHAVHVEAQTLDALFGEDRDRIAFVKCDVEGHELSCIRGAGDFLEGSDASWLVEVSSCPDDPGSEAHELFSLFSRGGYSAWYFDGRLLSRRKPGYQGMNYFFLKPRHVEGIMLKAPHLLAGARDPWK
jgi:FkbM family methyltransferase